MLVGYARVSTEDQSLDLQRDALREAGCEVIFEDTASGGASERPALLPSVLIGERWPNGFHARPLTRPLTSTGVMDRIRAV